MYKNCLIYTSVIYRVCLQVCYIGGRYFHISGSFHHRNVKTIDFHGVDGRRKKDIVLAKINLTIVIIFIIAHLGRWIPSIFVLVWVRTNFWFKVIATTELSSIFASMLGFKNNEQNIY